VCSVIESESDCENNRPPFEKKHPCSHRGTILVTPSPTTRVSGLQGHRSHPRDPFSHVLTESGLDTGFSQQKIINRPLI